MYEGENRIYIGVLVAAGVIIATIAGFLYMAAKYHRSRRLLHARQVVAEIDAIENDRKRIAADLHDEIGSLLTCVKLMVSSWSINTLSDNDLLTVRHHLNSMHESLLVITDDLMPGTLARNGLLGALEEFITDLEHRMPFEINYQVFGLRDSCIPPTWKVHIYRIVAELFQNTAKHSGATRISLIMSVVNRGLSIRYCDNGRGFDTANGMMLKPGLGLKNINSRITTMGGRLTLKTGQNKGALYEFQIPLPADSRETDNCR